MTPADGGAAFPLGGAFGPINDGMSLRDWFAGQALASSACAYDGTIMTAEAAYRVADAMLAERAK